MALQFEMVAKTFQGLEDVLRDELIALGARNVETGLRMVQFEGDLEMLYKANLCCRTALRILKPIVKFTASDPDELYDKIRDLEWEQFMTPKSTFMIDATVNSTDFPHSKFATYRVKDGIVDHFYDKYRERPSIRLSNADLRLNVHIVDDRVTVSLDSSGEPLNQRGYRKDTVKAPINEVLAAGIIMKTGWRGDCDFADPMCGSGTFLIEAALIAANINPGIYRDHFAFEKWDDFDRDLFERLYNDDSGEKEFTHKIYGGDMDPEAIAITRKNLREAGKEVEVMVELRCAPFEEWESPSEQGVMVTNPPYGERLRPERISELYKGIGATLKRRFPGWHAWIISSKDEKFSDIGLKPSVKFPLLNGSLECELREYVLFNGNYSDFKKDGGTVHNDTFNRERKGGKRESDGEWKAGARRFNKESGFGKDTGSKRKKKDDKSPRKGDGFKGAPRGKREENGRREKPRRTEGSRPLRRPEEKPALRSAGIKQILDKGPKIPADKAMHFVPEGTTMRSRRKKKAEDETPNLDNR